MSGPIIHRRYSTAAWNSPRTTPEPCSSGHSVVPPLRLGSHREEPFDILVGRHDAQDLATDDPVAKAVLADIRDEEKAHMGELITLMRHLDPRETELFLEGEGEVMEELKELGIKTD